MIKVEKDFDDVPPLLKKQNRKDAFLQNIADGSYTDEKNWYKGGSIQKELNEVYNLKCAYCEKKLLDSPKHIEHYRPKDIYYWLAYSWDNLLLCCTSCNSSKGTKFEIEGIQQEYNEESFEDIHKISLDYDIEEHPKIINPEREDILDEIIFNKDSIISSSNSRVTHTINNACKLNREELVKLRIGLLNDFTILVNEYYLLFDENNQQDKSTVVKFFLPLVKKFIDDCSIENEFYSFRYFILNNIELFFDGKDDMVEILKYLITKLDRES